jgi:PiT family inorganic phosphate transporter
VAFTLQSVAYGANDGQKMLAVYAAAGGAGALSALTVLDVLVVAAPFVVGATLGLRRYARTLGLKVLPVRPLNAVAAEASAAGIAITTGLAGSPVSSTQSLVTALIGSGLREGHLRVRWQTVSAIGVAWVTTFPLAVGFGVVVGRMTKVFS